MIFFLFLEIFFLLVSGQRGKFCGGVLRVLLCIFFDLFFLCRSGRAVLIDFNRYCATQLMIGKFRKSADMLANFSSNYRAIYRSFLENFLSNQREECHYQLEARQRNFTVKILWIFYIFKNYSYLPKFQIIATAERFWNPGP